MGYSSGALCVYDLAAIQVLGDCAAHDAPVVGLVFPFVHSPDCVLSASAHGHLVRSGTLPYSDVKVANRTISGGR